jgi:hypothetical protein
MNNMQLPGKIIFYTEEEAVVTNANCEVLQKRKLIINTKMKKKDDQCALNSATS